MELYRKVIIKSEDDMPKEAGEYFCNRSGFMSVQKLIPELNKTYMREIRWYLLPVEPEIPMKEVKSDIPRAYEWHNYKTGHCYVDYGCKHNENDGIWIPLDEKNGYTKIPLYASQFTTQRQVTDKEIELAAFYYYGEHNTPRYFAYCEGAKAMRDGKIGKQ